jgi:hypothetical protein
MDSYENGKKLAGVIYIHRISDIRMSGISTRNFNMFRQLCGDSTLKNVVMLTNMWGDVTREVGEAREADLASQDLFSSQFWRKMPCFSVTRIQPCRRMPFFSAYFEIDHIRFKILRELVDEKKDISETAAGVELNNEMMGQIEKLWGMETLQEAMKGTY